MKKFNKIIAVLLVISLISSFAVYASAEVSTGTFQMRYTDTDGKQITSAKAGEIIDVYLAINTADRYVSTFQADVMYDYALLSQTQATATTQKTPTVKNAAELLGDIADADTMIEDDSDPIFAATLENHPEFEDLYYYMLCGYGATKITPHKASFYPVSWTDVETAKYKMCRITYGTNYEEPTLGVYTNNQFVDFARIRFIAQADIATLDSSVIGWCADNDYLMDTDGANEPISVYMGNGVINMPVALAYAEVSAPTYLVNPVKNQIQWNNKNEKSVNIGVVAGFSADDIKINFVKGVSDNVTKIGTIYKINGEVQSPELTTNRVYSVNGGESYNFRIVLGNISTETTDTYSVIPYVVYNGETVYGPEIKITPDDVTTLVDRLS